jgi:hypothetical protein
VFENRVLRRISGLRDYMIESWRILHNEKLNNLYTWPKMIRLKKSRRMSWADHVACVGKKSNEDTAPVRKLEEKRQRRRWKDSMKMVSKKW